MPLDSTKLVAPEMSVLDAVLPELRSGENAFDGAQRLLIIEALLFTDGNQREAAKMLGLTPRVMCYWVRRYGLRRGSDVAERSGDGDDAHTEQPGSAE